MRASARLLFAIAFIGGMDNAALAGSRVSLADLLGQGYEVKATSTLSLTDSKAVNEIEKQGLVEKFVSHATVEALTEAVLQRISRCDEMPCDRVVLRRREDGVRGELRAVVASKEA